MFLEELQADKVPSNTIFNHDIPYNIIHDYKSGHIYLHQLLMYGESLPMEDEAGGLQESQHQLH